MKDRERARGKTSAQGTHFRRQKPRERCLPSPVTPCLERSASP